MRKESVLLFTLRNLFLHFQMVDYLKSDAFPLGTEHLFVGILSAYGLYSLLIIVHHSITKITVQTICSSPRDNAAVSVKL